MQLMLFLFSIQLQAKPKIWVENPKSFFSIFDENVFHKNGKKGFDGDIRDLVKDNKEALKWATKSHSAFQWQKAWSFGSFVSLLSGLGVFFVPNLSKVETAGILLGSLTLYTSSNLLSLSYMFDHKHYLDKAINTYNGVYETTAKSVAYRFDKELRGDIMLGMMRF